jgi:hypothetical protein
MARIIFELDAIEDIKIKLDSLIQKGQKIDSIDFKKLAKPNTGFLDENEKLVFRCIKENEGQSGQDIVNSLENAPPGESLSRKPVFNAIKSLIKRGMVVSEPDVRNRRKLRLYVNRGNLIIQVEKEIKDFRNSYLKLIKRADEEYRKKLDLTVDQLRKSKRRDLDIVGVADRLTDIFRQLIISYSLDAIFKWPQEIKDLESLNRLYLTVFQSLNEIYSELVKYVPVDIQDEVKRIEYLQDDLKYTFEDAKMYVEMIPEFDEYNLRSEFDSVMSNLFRTFKMHTTWKDYRTGLNEYKSEYPL